METPFPARLVQVSSPSDGIEATLPDVSDLTVPFLRHSPCPERLVASRGSANGTTGLSGVAIAGSKIIRCAIDIAAFLAHTTFHVCFASIWLPVSILCGVA